MGNSVWLCILAMIVVSFLIRVLPLTLIRKQIKNPFLKSFLYYVPYAVLGAMTIPAIFFSTGSIFSAIAGFLVAIFLSWKEKSLLTVAGFASFAVLIFELIF